MKKRLLVGLLAIVALVFGVWLFLRPHGEIPTAKSSHPLAAKQPQTVHANQSKLLQSYPSAEEQAQSLEQKQARYLKKSLEVNKQLNRVISFYGQILDQDNQPLTGIQIEGHYSFFNTVIPTLEPEQKKVAFTSDTNGRFEFEDEKGLSLQLQVQPKEGYEFKNNGILIIPFQVGAPVISTPDKPYIFHAFKKGQTEPLIVGGMVFYDCKPDGRWYAADLKSKQIMEGESNGEFKISVTSPFGSMGHTNQDWSIRIEEIRVGLIEETNDPFMYQAPESGYQSSWSYAQQAGEPKYKREVHSKFYLKSQDGSMYGRMNMDILVGGRDGPAIEIHYWLNPFGSRNLEYDKNKQITPELIQRVGLEKAIENARGQEERQKKYEKSFGETSASQGQQ